MGVYIFFNISFMAIISGILSGVRFQIHPAFSILIGVGVFVIGVILGFVMDDYRAPYWNHQKNSCQKPRTLKMRKICHSVIFAPQAIIWSLIYGFTVYTIAGGDIIWFGVIAGFALTINIAVLIYSIYSDNVFM